MRQIYQRIPTVLCMLLNAYKLDTTKVAIVYFWNTRIFDLLKVQQWQQQKLHPWNHWYHELENKFMQWEAFRPFVACLKDLISTIDHLFTQNTIFSKLCNNKRPLHPFISIRIAKISRRFILHNDPFFETKLWVVNPVSRATSIRASIDGNATWQLLCSNSLSMSRFQSDAELIRSFEWMT